MLISGAYSQKSVLGSMAMISRNLFLEDFMALKKKEEMNEEVWQKSNRLKFSVPGDQISSYQ